MSLILEALRKSEAERRRGDTPGLHAELPPPAPLARRAFPAYAWSVAAIVLALAIAGWIASRPQPPTTSAAGAPVATTPAPTPPRATAGEPVGDYPEVQRIAPPAASAAPPPTPAVPALSTAAVEPGATPPVLPSAAPPVATPPPVVPTVDAARSAGVPAASAPTPGASANATNPGGRLPTVAELPAAERGQLPELKLTMHMLNERPALRFVILDGVRYREGERVGAATITRIDAEGVVLDLDGRAVRLPLR